MLYWVSRGLKGIGHVIEKADLGGARADIGGEAAEIRGQRLTAHCYYQTFMCQSIKASLWPATTS